MAGQDGDSTPSKSTSKSFSDARDGKEMEPNSGPHYTKQQHAAADRLIDANAKETSRGKASDVKAAEGRFDFSVASEDKPQEKTSQHEKPTSKENYQSKTDGKTYTDQKAVAAAKAIDKDQANKEVAAKKERTTHHASAPKPSYASSNPKRGVTMQDKGDQEKADHKAAEESAKENRLNLAADMAAKNNQNKGKTPPDKGMGR